MAPFEGPRQGCYEHVWKRIKPELGHLYIEEVGTSALDSFKQTLPKHLGPKSINQHLIVVRAVFRFMWTTAFTVPVEVRVT